MLRRTFLFLRNVGPKTEARLWAAGAADWRDLPRVAANDGRLAGWQRTIDAAEAALASGDGAWFARRLPSAALWRLWPEFESRAVYLDIETTGLSPAWSEVTVVGLARRGKYHAYVSGFDLERVPAALEGAGLLVSFNGISFDLPYLEHAFRGRLAPRAAHLDLRYLLAHNGYKGGLKAIEHALGWSRPEGVEGLTGFDAVRLWRAYERGDAASLETLISYNREDVLNLQKLLGVGVSLERDALAAAE